MVLSSRPSIMLAERALSTSCLLPSAAPKEDDESCKNDDTNATMMRTNGRLDRCVNRWEGKKNPPFSLSATLDEIGVSLRLETLSCTALPCFLPCALLLSSLPLTVSFFSSFADFLLRPCQSCSGTGASGSRMERTWRRPCSHRRPGRAQCEHLF